MATISPNSNNPHELLICSICDEPYDDKIRQAKFLSCHHTFCSDCAGKLSDEVNPAVIKCPSCRHRTRLPENGADGLQTNFYVASFQEFSNTIEPPASFQCCHGLDARIFFCVTCGISICRDCASIDHRATSGHFVISITKAETAFIEELSVGQKSLNMNKRNMKIVESEMALLIAAKETVTNDIETFIKSSHEELEERRRNLVDLISDQFNVRHKVLMDKMEQIEEVNKILNDNVTEAKRITKTGDLDKLKPFSESLSKVNEQTKAISSNLDLGENYLIFNSNKGLDEFKHSLCTLGQVLTKGFLPSGVSFRNTKATAGHKAILSLEVYDHHGDKVPISSGSLTLQITDAADTELQTLLYTNSSECTATFTPQMGGLHKVSVMFLGQKLFSEQSHISVSRNNPVLKFGKTGGGHGAFNGSWDIAIDKNNCIFVADTNNQLIQKFTPDGEFLSQFSVAIDNKHFTTYAIALDLDEGLIFCVASLQQGTGFSATNSLLVFNVDGDLQQTLTLSDGLKAFSIALDRKDHIILSDIQK